MEEDQEMERFGMDNDYDDGQWIDGEFYYRRRWEKRAQTKDDVLYGVFASGDSDSDYDESSKRKRRKNKDLLGKADLSKPVNFVSTGTVMPNREIDENSKRENVRMTSLLPWTRIGREKEGEKESFLPTAFGRKIKEGAIQIGEESAARRGGGGGGESVLRGILYDLGNVGGFEKYTPRELE
ncbi:septin and tuftelin-interacting protein 1 homolog 1-like [Syzygium oleosum]|uniref:septin and tuftelin-interacting protein 1 homolog 1-like n=1 Tax=Syzygium oleosum TaxID=219896 RepID=UPI0024BBBCF9|nr:septin and tuftelin-interacting protein 1 homolog 1-like [Syzygium oleosum]